MAAATVELACKSWREARIYGTRSEVRICLMANEAVVCGEAVMAKVDVSRRDLLSAGAALGSVALAGQPADARSIAGGRQSDGTPSNCRHRWPCRRRPPIGRAGVASQDLRARPLDRRPWRASRYRSSSTSNRARPLTSDRPHRCGHCGRSSDTPRPHRRSMNRFRGADRW